MKLDLELYIDLLQDELKRLRALVKDLEENKAPGFPEIPPRPVRQGASMEPIHVDETRLSPETKEHFDRYVTATNSQFSRLLGMDVKT